MLGIQAPALNIGGQISTELAGNGLVKKSTTGESLGAGATSRRKSLVGAELPTQKPIQEVVLAMQRKIGML